MKRAIDWLANVGGTCKSGIPSVRIYKLLTIRESGIFGSSAVNWRSPIPLGESEGGFGKRTRDAERGADKGNEGEEHYDW